MGNYTDRNKECKYVNLLVHCKYYVNIPYASLYCNASLINLWTIIVTKVYVVSFKIYRIGFGNHSDYGQHYYFLSCIYTCCVLDSVENAY